MDRRSIPRIGLAHTGSNPNDLCLVLVAKGLRAIRKMAAHLAARLRLRRVRCLIAESLPGHVSVTGWRPRMKTLSIQIQPDLQPDIDFDVKVSDLHDRIRDDPLVEKFSVDSGLKNGRFINVNIETSDVASLWKMVRSTLGLGTADKSPFSEAAIVVCEGEDGWNDYRLLHHFDGAEQVDTFE